MARLASQAKMGYFPTPKSVMALIKSMIKIDQDPSQYAALDPCCGTGEFAQAMPEGITTYGNDLDKERFQLAKETVDHVLYGDALYDFQATNNAFSCLYLNPPYDWGKDQDGKSARMELLFLRQYTKYLKRDGLLIFIIPKDQLEPCAEHLAFHYKGIQVFPFPEKDYEAFSQLVIFGYRKPGKDEQTKEMLIEVSKFREWYEPLPLGRLDEVELEEPLTMATAKEIKTFRSLKINPEDLTKTLEHNGSKVEELFTIEDTGTIRTPMPLRKGHMAMLLASGYMNGEFKNGTHWYLVKGSTSKRVQVFEGESERRELDKIDIVLKALDLNNAEFLDIK